MPSLEFKGKQFVYSHHHTVPFRELVVDEKKSLPKDSKANLDDNLIIHGDNLHALKALMPRYAGKVKCIYIDPPYNTGNEGWVYNDNVNSPLMKQWLKDMKPVDREDMERHDKWLCMMYPRLKLLHELLADDGVIFVSIDDNEVYHLRMLMDEVFGEENFRNTIILRRRTKSLNSQFADDGLQTMNVGFEYVIAYAKNRSFVMSPIRSNKQNASDKGRWDVFWSTADRPTMRYELLGFTPETGQWRNSYKKAIIAVENYKEFQQNFENKMSLEEYWKFTGCELSFIRRIPNGTGKNGGVQHWVAPSDSMLRTSNWTDIEVSQIGKEFDLQFDNPKNKSPIIELIRLSGAGNDDIILDSFAGSGTTAHAVLDLNREDGGNRKFILIECENYADSITAERVRRVIKGVPTAKDEKIKNGLGGSFTFCELGQAMEIEKMLTGESLPAYENLASYVFYTSTGKSLEKPAKSNPDFFVGETDLYEIYLIYKPDLAFLRGNESALNFDKVEIIKSRSASKKTKLVFATAKFMGQKELAESGISFCQLPYAIHKIAGK